MARSYVIKNPGKPVLLFYGDTHIATITTTAAGMPVTDLTRDGATFL